MSFSLLLAGLAGALSLFGYIPYGRDILAGKVRPARSSRLMLTMLVTLALLQQYSLGAGLVLAVTAGEVIGSLAILAIGLRRGSGGWQPLDRLCYGLLALDLLWWWLTGSAFEALILNIAADVIAFYPTLHKTWRDPRSETALFYATGLAAPLLGLAAGRQLTLAVALYPLALALENGLEVALIHRRR